MAAPDSNSRRRKPTDRRRRLADDPDDPSTGQPGEVHDDDSLTDGSVITDDNDAAHDSDTSNVEENSPTSPNMLKRHGNGFAQTGSTKTTTVVGDGDDSNNDSMHNSRHDGPTQGDDPSDTSATEAEAAVVSSDAANQSQEPVVDNRRREHDEYCKKRDEDPAFVPNRGAFFMHDHRHSGPAANGFRPFGRGGRGRGRGGFGGPFGPMGPMHMQHDPTTSPWAHDMHETIEGNHNAAFRHPPPGPMGRGGSIGINSIPISAPSSMPINRSLSTEKVLGNVQIRIFLPQMAKSATMPSTTIRQYTKLPDHRPPLRRDKPVRISMPHAQPKYIYPAADRSFVFIPRALRPGQPRSRGSRTHFGSIGGFSRRTSIYGGSHFGGNGSYYGSTYAPSVAMSRRSSIVAPDMGRDVIISPTSSAFSRPPMPMPMEAARPVVRLPPQFGAHQAVAVAAPATSFVAAPAPAAVPVLPAPHTHPLPQKPTFTDALPLHQPRPQKAVSVADIEAPGVSVESVTQPQPPSQPQQQQQAFHHQVPVQYQASLVQDAHTRHASTASLRGTGTPLQQIPESAIHAAPFQPTAYPQQQQQQQQQSGYYGPAYPMMPVQPSYYYPQQSYNAPILGPPSASAPAFVPGMQAQPAQYAQPTPAPTQPHTPNAPASAQQQNLVAQEVNGMVYYYDASQIPASVPTYTAPYPAYTQPMMGGVSSNGQGIEGYYYPQQTSSVAYYPQ